MRVYDLFLRMLLLHTHSPPSLLSHISRSKCTLGFLGQDCSIRDVPADGEGAGQVV